MATNLNEALEPDEGAVPASGDDPQNTVDDYSDDDIDHAALREAEAALEAEEKDDDVADGPEADAATPAQQNDDDAEQGDKGEKDQKDVIMVPKQRLDQEARARRQAEAAAIGHQAQVNLLTDLIQKGHINAGALQSNGAQEEPPATPQERVADLQRQQREIAKKYQEGEIDLDEHVEQNQQLDNQIFEARQEIMSSDRASDDKPPVDLALQERTREIEEQHPVLNHVSREDLEYLKPIVLGKMGAEGIEMGTPASTLELRRRIAEMASSVYADRIPEEQRKPPPQTEQPQDGKQPNGQQESRQPKADVDPQQRIDKLNLSRQQPPDIHQADGNNNSGLENLTEERILSMTTEEIENLPEALLDRIEEKGL